MPAALKIKILLELDHPLATYTDMVEVYVSVQITLRICDLCILRELQT